jgi:hypothetical protein
MRTYTWIDSPWADEDELIPSGLPIKMLLSAIRWFEIWFNDGVDDLGIRLVDKNDALIRGDHDLSLFTERS